MVGFCAAKRVLVEVEQQVLLEQQQVFVEVEQQQEERRREFARCRLLRTTAYGEQAELAKFAAKFAEQVRQSSSPRENPRCAAAIPM
jgi:glycerate-2-kinase